MEVKIKPGLFWIGDKQSISFKPANHTMDYSVEQALLDWSRQSKEGVVTQ
jgi:hypothetical protein